MLEGEGPSGRSVCIFKLAVQHLLRYPTCVRCFETLGIQCVLVQACQGRVTGCSAGNISYKWDIMDILAGFECLAYTY